MERGLDLKMPSGVKEDMGAGLRGVVGDRRVGAGSLDMIFAGAKSPNGPAAPPDGQNGARL